MSVEQSVLRLIRTLVRFLTECRIHVGCDPQRVEAPALILFPHRPATLCCGLAGILTLRRKTQPAAADVDLSILFARAAEKNLTALLRGTILFDGLSGRDSDSGGDGAGAFPNEGGGGLREDLLR